MMWDRYPLYLVKVGERDAAVILPDMQEAKEALPWVAYHTGAGETCASLTATEASASDKAGIVKLLLERGFVVCSITSGPAHWGDPSAEEAHEALYQYMQGTFPVAKKVNIWMQSMGGMSAYPWAIRHPDRVLRMYGVYPITNRTEMGARSPIHNLEPLAKEEVKIMHRHGLADTVVPFDLNAKQFEEAYKKLGGQIKIIAVPGLGHQVDPLLFVSDEVADFFQGKSF